MSRKLTEAKKKIIAGRQYYKCANKPGTKLEGLVDYECPLWKNIDKELRGNFDASGYDIDHIVEFCITQDDNENNLQALCNNCHSYKTRRFMMNRKKIIDSNDDDENSYDENSDDGNSDNENSYDECSDDENNDDENNENNNGKIQHVIMFRCSTCHKNFATNYNLRRHKNTCNVNKNISTIFKCKYCKRPFTRKDSVTKHINKGRCKKKPVKSKNNCEEPIVNNAIKSPNSNNVYNIGPIILVSIKGNGSVNK
jgi:hypothetical protein